MPFTVTMPKLSPTMEVGTIAQWHKKEGDLVEPGDLLLEVATDKATVEHNAIDEGILRKIIISEGQDAIVNQPIAIFTENADESIEGYEPEGESPAEEVEVAPSEEAPAQKQAAPAAPAPTAGFHQPAYGPLPPLEDYEFEMPTDALSKRVLVSPLARKLAKEQGLDLTTVKGSGPGGRIMKKDLERAQPLGTVTFGHREMPMDKPGSYEEIPLSQMRKVISQRLQEAKTFIPHFYVTQAINVEAMIETREQLKNMGLKVSFNDFAVRACALALKEHPNVNAGFNSVNQTIVQYKTVDISIAVSVEEGLITPIVRHANFKNLGELSVEIKSLAKRAHAGKLDPHEYLGGSFTVSNLGMYGVTDFQAIINPPQAAILAVSGIQDVPVVKDGEVVPGKVMNVTLSADHRVVDGVAGAEFVKSVQKFLENPSSLLL